MENKEETNKTNATVRPKTLVEKFTDIFGDDLKSIVKTIIKEDIKPRLQDMTLDAINNAATKLIYGKEKPVRSIIKNSNGSTNYNKVSEQNTNNKMISSKEVELGVGDFNRLEFSTRYEAESKLREMNKILLTNGFVPVGKFYEICEIKNFKYTTFNYGWYSLDGAYIDYSKHDRSKYTIVLPSPECVM